METGGGTDSKEAQIFVEPDAPTRRTDREMRRDEVDVVPPSRRNRNEYRIDFNRRKASTADTMGN